MRGRVALAAAGLAAMGFGVSVLLTDRYIRDPLDVVEWLAGAVLLHDGVLVPAVLLVGAALRVGGGPAARRLLRAGLTVSGCVTAVALPALLGPGTPGNPSVLPLDYPGDLALVLTAVAVATAAAVCWAVLGPPGRPAGRGTAEQPAGRSNPPGEGGG